MASSVTQLTLLHGWYIAVAKNSLVCHRVVVLCRGEAQFPSVLLAKNHVQLNRIDSAPQSQCNRTCSGCCVESNYLTVRHTGVKGIADGVCKQKL